MREAVLHLTDLGHKRVGFVNGGTRYNFSWLTKKDFVKAWQRRGYLLIQASVSLMR